MKRILVWDSPVRLLHWVIALASLGAWVLAEVAGKKSSAFPLHMLLGLLAIFAIVLRLGWSIVGTRYSRLQALALSPVALVVYLRGVLDRAVEPPQGHNPASSWAALALYAAICGLVGTGLMMVLGVPVDEELHEVLGGALLLVSAAHLVGVMWHSVRHREPLVLTMFDGRKLGRDDWAISSARPRAAMVLAALLLAGGGLLFSSWEGKSLSLGSLQLPLTQVDGKDKRDHELQRKDAEQESEDDD
jgi:cytochrome b